MESMKRIFLIILTFCLIREISVQSQTTHSSGSYYRLENIDSLNKYSLDSIRGELQYFGINEDIVDGLIFPIIIYKTFDDWTGDNLFNFIRKNQFSLDYIRTKGKLFNYNGKLYAELRFFNTDSVNLEKIIQKDSTLRVNILIKPDSVWINDRLFKKDKTGRIFQRFTGY
jgi:hypothetical protein